MSAASSSRRRSSASLPISSSTRSTPLAMAFALASGRVEPAAAAPGAVPSDVGIVHDLAETASPRDDVVVLVEAPLLGPALAGQGAQHLAVGQAAVHPQRVDDDLGPLLLEPQQVLRRDDQVQRHHLAGGEL